MLSKMSLVKMCIVFLLVFIAFQTVSVAETPKKEQLVFLYSDVGLTSACSYYQLPHPKNYDQFKTLGSNKIKEVYGELRDLRIEILVNESYEVSVPDYGELFANSTCDTGWVLDENDTYTCERIYANTTYKETKKCLNLYSINATNDTCEYNYTGVVGYHNETRYIGVWKPFTKYDFKIDEQEWKANKNKYRMAKATHNYLDQNIYNNLNGKFVNVRICGSYKPEKTPNGWEFPLTTYQVLLEKNTRNILGGTLLGVTGNQSIFQTRQGIWQITK